MKKLLGLVIVLCISYWMVRPLFGPGYFPMHDDTQVARVVEMGRALREGQFPVRWVNDLGYGYGYPIFNFYGPLPYYVGGFFYALGLSGLTATKLMMGLGLIGAGITMFFAVSEIVGISGGILAASYYMYAPYHAVDAYVRGAVGEYWALVFVPLIFLGLWRVVHSKAVSGLLLGSIGIAGLILSHTILGYAGMVFVGLASAILGVWQIKLRNWNVVKALIIFVVLGLGIATFFWLPGISEMKYTNVASQIGSSANFHDHFVCLPELWDSPWGFGGSAKGCLDGFSMKIGKEELLLGLLVLSGILVGWVRDPKGKKLFFVGLAILTVSVFFMLSISTRVWEVVPLFAYLQYPWRFLAFAIFGTSLMAGVAVFFARNSVVRWVGVAVAIAVILIVEGKRFNTQYTYVRPAADFETATDIEFRASKISDEYLPPAIVRPTKADQTVHGIIPASDKYTFAIQQDTDTYKKIQFLSGTVNKVQVNVAYFPGWTYQVNEFVVKPPLTNGLPVLTVPAGLTEVQMRFTDTPVRVVGNVMSVIAVCVWLFIYDKRKKIIS